MNDYKCNSLVKKHCNGEEGGGNLYMRLQDRPLQRPKWFVEVGYPQLKRSYETLYRLISKPPLHMFISMFEHMFTCKVTCMCSCMFHRKHCKTNIIWSRTVIVIMSYNLYCIRQKAYLSKEPMKYLSFAASCVPWRACFMVNGQ